MAGSKCGTSRRSISSANASPVPRRSRGIRHPRFGVLLPGSFLPGVDEDSVRRLAEQALLIATLSRLDNVRRRQDSIFSLAINVPVSVLLKLPIPALVEEHRPQSDRWPGIIVEVTEDQIVRDMRARARNREPAQVSGINIAIDDFGAGYSSFSSLRDLPFTEIKLDAASSRTARPTPPMPPSARPRSISPTASAAPRSRGHRNGRRLAGPDGDGLRFWPGRADRAADAAGAFSRIAAPAGAMRIGRQSKGIDEHGDANAPIPDSTARYSSAQGSP